MQIVCMVGGGGGGVCDRKSVLLGIYNSEYSVDN